MVCGKKCEVYSRIVGYFRPVHRWNLGKFAEYSDRRTFKISQEDFVREIDSEEYLKAVQNSPC